MCADPNDPSTCVQPQLCSYQDVPVTQNEHVLDGYSCTGRVVETHQEPLSSSHCSGPNTELTRAFDPTNPAAAEDTAPPQRDVLNTVVGGLPSGIQRNLGQNNSLIGRECGWARTSLTWRHRHHAYWSCHADAQGAFTDPATWNHTWYNPPDGTTNIVTSGPNGAVNPVQPGGGAECRDDHTYVPVVPALPITIPLRPRVLPDAPVSYACNRAHDPALCPDTCGTQDGDAHGYPVIRREAHPRARSDAAQRPRPDRVSSRYARR